MENEMGVDVSFLASAGLFWYLNMKKYQFIEFITLFENIVSLVADRRDCNFRRCDMSLKIGLLRYHDWIVSLTDDKNISIYDFDDFNDCDNFNYDVFGIWWLVLMYCFAPLKRRFLTH